MAHYSSHVKIVRAATNTTAAGTQAATGKWTQNPGVPQQQIIYEGPADVQDTVSRTVRDPSGKPNDRANGLVYLLNEEKIGLVQPDDQIFITWPDQSIEQAIIVEVRRLDGVLLIERLRPRAV